MIRKLTLAATLAATALAMIAAAAPAANADFQEFYVTDLNDVICSESPTSCIDTGYEAEVDFLNSIDQQFASCELHFTSTFDDFGQITVDPLGFTDCSTGLPWTPQIEQCHSSIQSQYPPEAFGWGQLFLPVGDLPYVELPFCYGIGQNHYFNRITLEPSGPGQWSQTDVSGTPGSKIANAVVENTVSEDNVKIVLGTP